MKVLIASSIVSSGSNFIWHPPSQKNKGLVLALTSFSLSYVIKCTRSASSKFLSISSKYLSLSPLASIAYLTVFNVIAPQFALPVNTISPSSLKYGDK